MKTNKKSGFTMVEIIAVLVIIGIMAAVAAPKFIGMAQDAREKAAVAGISEAKASLSVAYAKAYLNAGGVQPTETKVLEESGLSATETFGDVTVTLVATDGAGIALEATKLDTTALDAGAVTDTWDLPSN
ncbi:MAG: type II secretion system protein [Kiritimatiellaeota bacterium]|nr:type II secretion system protein [Kiritimatiellota bacterium]